MDALKEYRTNPAIYSEDITLKQLYDDWSKSKYQYISKSTKENYEGAWNKISHYGKEPFKDLRTGNFQAVIDAYHANNASRSTLSKVKILLGLLYNYAMQNDIVNKDYSDYVKLPKEEKIEKEIFSDIELQILEKNIALPWVDTILILIYTGLRISEFMNLTIFSVDFDNQVITGGLKTDAGKNRVIPIHSKIYPHIAKWKNRNGNRLICNEKGKAIPVRAYREDMYYPTLDILGIRKINPHGCRHTTASLLKRAGADTLAIQRILGHADYAFTANVYTHTNIEELKKAMSLM